MQLMIDSRRRAYMKFKIILIQCSSSVSEEIVLIGCLEGGDVQEILEPIAETECMRGTKAIERKLKAKEL